MGSYFFKKLILNVKLSDETILKVKWFTHMVSITLVICNVWSYITHFSAQDPKIKKHTLKKCLIFSQKHNYSELGKTISRSSVKYII